MYPNYPLALRGLMISDYQLLRILITADLFPSIYFKFLVQMHYLSVKSSVLYKYTHRLCTGKPQTLKSVHFQVAIYKHQAWKLKLKKNTENNYIMKARERSD